MRQRGILFALGIFIATLYPVPGRAAELLMVTTVGCPWCAKWEQELGHIYPRTPEGRRAPLRRVELQGFAEPLVLLDRLVYTPTFVLIDQGREIGRIVGYQNEDAFWGLLDRLIRQLDDRSTH